MCAAVAIMTGCGQGRDTGPEKNKPKPSPQGSASSAEKEPSKADKPEQKAPEKQQQAGKKQDSGNQQKQEVEEKQEDKPKEVELELDLPEPTFAGTPSDLKTMHLDPDAGGPRGNVYVPEGAELLSKGKPVSASGDPVMGELGRVTDGDKEAGEGHYVTLPPGKQWVQIDLEKTYKLDAIFIWHYHASARVYHDVIVQVSSDKDFEEGVKTVFNNDYDNSSGFGEGENYEYVENFEGKMVKPGGVKARYVRVYTNGSTANELNHFTEVAVYGRQAGE